MKLTPVGRAVANVPSRGPPSASRRKDHDRPGSAYRFPYVWCLTNTCIAADLADPKLIKKMETDRKLQLEVADSSVLPLRCRSTGSPQLGREFRCKRSSKPSPNDAQRRLTYAASAAAFSIGSIRDFARNGFVR
jgi:hypothetical protein